MSLLTDAVVPAGIGLCAIFILWMLKGFLNFVVGIPLYMLGMGIAIVMTVLLILVNILFSFYKWAPEGFAIMECRKDGKDAILETEIGTGRTELIIGRKKNPKDPVYEDEESGIKVDPSMVSAYSEPLRLPMGLNIFGYSHHSMFPQTNRNHLAFKGIIDYFNEISERVRTLGDKATKEDTTIAGLDFMTIKEKIELIGKPEHFLEEDMKVLVGRYFKERQSSIDSENEIEYYRSWSKMEPGEDGVVREQWYEQVVRIPALIHAVQQIKSDLNKRPIPSGYYCMTEAFKYNNVPYTAQHLASLKSKLQLMRDDYWMKMINWMMYGTIIIGIIGIVILGIYVLSTVLK